MFYEVFSGLHNTGYNLVANVNKSTKSPDRKHSGLRACRILPDELHYFVQASDKSGNSVAIPVIIITNDSYFDSERSIVIDGGKWMTNTEYYVHNNTKEIIYVVDVNAGSVYVRYLPVGGTTEEYLRGKVELVTTKDAARRQHLSKKCGNFRLLKHVAGIV